MALQRSYLFVAGSDPAAIADAQDSVADAVIVDLEDTVAPAAKERARSDTIEAVAEWSRSDQSVGVRVNGLDTTYGMADVEAVATADRRPEFVVVPDVRGPDELEIISSVFDNYGAETEILPLVETPSAVFAAQEIANVNERICGMGFAAIDFQKNMDVPILDDTDLSVPRYLISLAAHSAGVPAIDKPTLRDVDDTDRLRTEAAEAIAVGYGGKFVMNDEQASVVNDAFVPSQSEVERAERFVDAFDSQDEGLVTIDGVAVDKPVVSQLRDVLARAGRARRDD